MGEVLRFDVATRLKPQYCVPNRVTTSALVKRHGPASGPLTAKRVHAWCTQRARGGPASGSLAATSRG
uniref:Uncharacterized protein n=1 Tax=Caenorhabditis japonica TaxID=281687 RepID=A0A8R1IH56_CAEJA